MGVNADRRPGVSSGCSRSGEKVVVDLTDLTTGREHLVRLSGPCHWRSFADGASRPLVRPPWKGLRLGHHEVNRRTVHMRNRQET
jgi:hypothetical protein